MEFVNIFYQDYFKTLPLGNYDKLLEAVSIKMDRVEILKLMHNPEVLGNDTLSELVLIRSLYENFHNPDLTKKSILFVLKDIQKSTVIEEHKKIVTSVLKKLSGVEKGSYAPDFQLTDIEGNEVMLSDYYKDKYVYIDFWATWCKPCVREMKLTPELYKKYGREVEIVSISIDRKHRSMRRFAEKNKYKWTFLHYDGNEELKEAYKVNAIPLYYLIAPGGKVIYSPAPRPSKIEAKFEKIKAQGKPRRKAYELISD
jgi:thiol-disulfide isomerase/thioredoxin